MTVLAYIYEADVHCIDCTQVRFSDGSTHGSESDVATLRPATDSNGIWFQQADSEGNLIHAMQSYHEWQEYDETFLAENPTQYLACGDCHEVIDEYTHES